MRLKSHFAKREQDIRTVSPLRVFVTLSDVRLDEVVARCREWLVAQIEKYHSSLDAENDALPGGLFDLLARADKIES
jgi:hypothetical protein